MPSIVHCRPTPRARLPICADAAPASAPHDALRASPEYDLAVAVLRVARADMQSPCPGRREAARAFFRGDEGMLTFWCEVLGMEEGQLTRYAATVQAMPALPLPAPVQLLLFALETYA